MKNIESDALLEYSADQLYEVIIINKTINILDIINDLKPVEILSDNGVLLFLCLINQ